MARVNVFLKEELLKAIDAEAAESRTRRSALIQAALKAYLEARQKEREAAEIRREMDEASKGMDALAEKLGKWDPVKVIREFRDGRSLRVREPRKPYRPRNRRGRS
jgi:predicted transcriptional regulator